MVRWSGKHASWEGQRGIFCACSNATKRDIKQLGSGVTSLGDILISKQDVGTVRAPAPVGIAAFSPYWIDQVRRVFLLDAVRIEIAKLVPDNTVEQEK